MSAGTGTDHVDWGVGVLSPSVPGLPAILCESENFSSLRRNPANGCARAAEITIAGGETKVGKEKEREFALTPPAMLA